MVNEKLENIENRLNKLEKDRTHMVRHIQELQVIIQSLQQSNAGASLGVEQPINAKIEYLSVANEQMFRQNQRLRAIEDCIQGNEVLDQKGYLHALSGDA